MAAGPFRFAFIGDLAPAAISSGCRGACIIPEIQPFVTGGEVIHGIGAVSKNVLCIQRCTDFFVEKTVFILASPAANDTKVGQAFYRCIEKRSYERPLGIECQRQGS